MKIFSHQSQNCGMWALLKERDRDLRTPTEKPGFLPNMRVTTQYFRKKPGF